MPGIKIETKGIRSMRKVPVLAQLSILGLLSLALVPFTFADSVTVKASDDIYAAGSQSGLAAINVSGATSYTFSATTSSDLLGGLVTMNFGGGGYQCFGCSTGNGTDLNDADGLTPAFYASHTYGPNATSSNKGTQFISGITAPGVGYLVGVFIAADGPSGTLPTAYDFTSGSLGTNFLTLSPALDQVFFIGDGWTGDGGLGSVQQTFYVPGGAGDGATKLYLGISDACGYQGDPGCYYDNVGTYNVNAMPGDATEGPEPSSLLLFGTGILGMVGMLRRRILTR